MEIHPIGVIGATLSTDNAVVRWDGVTGSLIQNSGVIIDDSDNMSGIGTISIATKLIHTGDADTFISFTPDSMLFDAGGVSFLRFTKLFPPGFPHTMNFNANSADMDMRFLTTGNAFTLFIDGSEDRVGIGTGTPGATLEVAGGLIVDTDTLVVDATANRVGIGTASPDATFHVQNVSTGFSWSPVSGTVAIFESATSNRAFLTV